MSGFIGWYEIMTAEESVIEHEIKQIRVLSRDISCRISRVERFSGERFATENIEKMINTLPDCLECVHSRIYTMTTKAFDEHRKRNGDK